LRFGEAFTRLSRRRERSVLEYMSTGPQRIEAKLEIAGPPPRRLDPSGLAPAVPFCYSSAAP
jgi:hypothetical protein